ncbi:hypothetical protein HOLleu_38848 [Holothuria leucospilota]|uniref:Uncharacterized protein n=1 Tax=Holothuria leucospilota TaxID=206669 RepID=A0A9Q0YJD0_HOLLE|nr:hypothetical protein HOLleu_38848 [Holothuria leucospilota]
MPHSPNSWTRNWPGIEEPGIGYRSELKGILDSGLTTNGGHLNLHWPGFGRSKTKLCQLLTMFLQRKSMSLQLLRHG